MKASELIGKLATIIADYGDMPIRVSLLSNNGDYDLQEISVSSWYENTDAKHITIDCEIEDIKDIYNILK